MGCSRDRAAQGCGRGTTAGGGGGGQPQGLLQLRVPAARDTWPKVLTICIGSTVAANPAKREQCQEKEHMRARTHRRWRPHGGAAPWTGAESRANACGLAPPGGVSCPCSAVTACVAALFKALSEGGFVIASGIRHLLQNTENMFSSTVTTQPRLKEMNGQIHGMEPEGRGKCLIYSV